MTEHASLFAPFQCRGLALKNRVVMAPMTRSFSPNGIPGPDVAAYYRRRAEADVGYIVTEGTTIDRPGASNDARVPNLHDPAAIEGWKSVVQQVHEAGGKIAVQLWHVGMMRKPGTGPHPDAASDSPSGLTHTGKAVLPSPTEEEIADMIDAYARGAAEAARIGFDGIEIHGAHGYLIDQFFWDVMNVRGDRFGGSLVERATFAAEVIKACRRAVGTEMPITLRWSQWKQQDFKARLAPTPQALESFLAVFVDAGIDILHASQRRFWEPEYPDVDGPSGLNLAGWCKKLTGLPTITVGSVGLAVDFVDGFRGEGSKTRPIRDVVERLDRGEFDLIAVGRALLQDPHWVMKVREGRLDELRDYDAAAVQTLH